MVAPLPQSLPTPHTIRRERGWGEREKVGSLGMEGKVDTTRRESESGGKREWEGRETGVGLLK